MKATFLVALLLVSPAAANQIVDVAKVSGDDPYVLDDTGRIWRANFANYPQVTCDYIYLGEFSGAIDMDVWEENSGSLSFAIAMSNGDVEVYNFYRGPLTFDHVATYPTPVADIAYVSWPGITGGTTQVDFIVVDTAGRIWWDSAYGWASCPGPSSPVSLDSQSWGQIKGAHR